MSSDSQEQERAAHGQSEKFATLPQLPVLIEKLKYVVMGLSLLDAAGPKYARPDGNEEDVERGEYRTYYLSPFTLRNEREMLEKYESNPSRIWTSCKG